MIEITEAAAKQLNQIRTADPTHGVLRVYLAGQSCCSPRYGLAFDVAADADDAKLEHSGIPMAVDPQTMQVADGATIDFVDGEAGKGFVVRNPNAKGGGCACGSR
ncbi:MAG: iron-sulfur cluster assembly accessory protein [Chloroflexi bacterium]|nr:iron-sulfur cluster assembly accessory protein [Chloroflexota bacterium]